ncbi:MAG: primosomal protein N' [Pseudomonadota bacterium]
MIHLEVAVAAPVTETLTYSYSADDARLLRPGIRLLVPLGARRVTGYLLAVRTPGETPYQIRAVTDVLDREPLFPQTLIPFFRWVSSYYDYPLGETIKIALPGGLSPHSDRQVRLAPAGEEFLLDWENKNPDTTPDWLEDFKSKGLLSAARLRPIWRRKKWQSLLKKWQEAGAVVIEECIIASRSKAKTEKCACLPKNNTACPTTKLKPSEQKTLTLIRELTMGDPSVMIPLSRLNQHYSGAGRAVKALSEKQLVHLTEQEVLRDPFGEEPPFYPPPSQLTDEQNEVLAQLLPAVAGKKFITFLLHGITGSGKTEVYLQACQKTIEAGRSVLVLVPEIALASQLEAHFYSRFGRQVALLHSGLSDGERFDQWRRIMGGHAKIVIGARSAIFAPLNDPGLIIVDEEHDGAYKQEDTLRYQARDMAVLRGKLQDCPVILGSATPSLTSFHHARNNKYQLLTLNNRIENRPLPGVTIVDLKSAPKNGSSHPFFSRELLGALKENLADGNQSILFLNRRGYANLMICADCGSPVKCLHCDISLTLHKGRGQLCCHYCGYTAKSAIICPACLSPRVKEIGFGTERVEEALAAEFPGARIARLDRDTSTNRKNFLKILKDVHQQRIDILVGTQMITKGHHFPHVTLVGVIWADAGLGLPDFKAGERTFQLISQVTGRAGRGEKPGRVYIQTHQPDHYALTNAQQHDYSSFYEKEIFLREKLFYPPFSRLINLRFSGDNGLKVEDAAKETARTANTMAAAFRVTVLGPAPAPLARLRDKYRWQLLLKGEDSASLHDFCRQLVTRNGCRATGVDMQVDVDPESLL